MTKISGMSTVTEAPSSNKEHFEKGEDNRNSTTGEPKLAEPLDLNVDVLAVDNVVTTHRHQSFTHLKIKKTLSSEIIDNDKIYEKEKENHYYDKNSISFFDILKCPLTYHTNFVGTFLFIIGCCCFYSMHLIHVGYWIFAVACALLMHSNTVSAVVHKDNATELGGFLFYNTGSSIFLVGSIYALYLNELWSIIYFISGSFCYLIGSLFFLYSINLKKIKLVCKLVLIVFLANFIGGVFFTIASFMFLKPSLFMEGVSLYVLGSILYTMATYFDYIIYFKYNIHICS